MKKSLLISSICISSMANIAYATPPMAKFQAPAFHRFMLGNFEITTINDGISMLPADKLLHQNSQKTQKELDNNFLKTPVPTSVNTFLVHTGQKLVLIDTGGGDIKGDSLGKLISNLKASGYNAEDIDEVYITHFHGDHLGGLIKDNKLAFPSAILRMDKKELDYWLSKENQQKAPKDKQQAFTDAQNILKPYLDANKVMPFDKNQTLTQGISSYSTSGHTHGHTSYVVESNGEKMVVLGDLIHVISVQMPNPKITIDFDSNPSQAYQQRKSVFDMAVNQKYLVAGAHIPFPAVGHILKKNDGYEWLLLNYK